MIALLFTLLSAAPAEENALQAFAGVLARRIQTEGPAVVIFTAEPGRSCRAALDAVGERLARSGHPLHLVDGSEARALDFLQPPGPVHSDFRRFADYNRGKGLVLVHRSARFEDQVGTKIARLMTEGEDREKWNAFSTAGMTYLFETRPTAPFGPKTIVRDLTRRVFHTTLDGCTYHVVTRADFEALGRTTCEDQVVSIRSGWFQEAEIPAE